MGMERCGKINASNSGADSWTGIGVVAGFCTVVLIMQWPHRRNGEVTWRGELLQRLQEVRGNCKTRNQLFDIGDEARIENALAIVRRIKAAIKIEISPSEIQPDLFGHLF